MLKIHDFKMKSCQSVFFFFLKIEFSFASSDADNDSTICPAIWHSYVFAPHPPSGIRAVTPFGAKVLVHLQHHEAFLP